MDNMKKFIKFHCIEFFSLPSNAKVLFCVVWPENQKKKNYK